MRTLGFAVGMALLVPCLPLLAVIDALDSLVEEASHIKRR